MVPLLSNANILTATTLSVLSAVPECVLILEPVKAAKLSLIQKASVYGVDQLMDLICHINYDIMCGFSVGDLPCNTHSQFWSPYACAIAHHCKKIKHHNQFLINCKSSKRALAKRFSFP